MSATIYRRITGRDTWHFHRWCQHSRAMDSGKSKIGRTSTSKPRGGELCNECQAKARADGKLGRKR